MTRLRYIAELNSLQTRTSHIKLLFETKAQPGDTQELPGGAYCNLVGQTHPIYFEGETKVGTTKTAKNFESRTIRLSGG